MNNQTIDTSELTQKFDVRDLLEAFQREQQAQFMGFEGKQAETVRALAIALRNQSKLVERLVNDLVIAKSDAQEARREAHMAHEAARSSCCPWCSQRGTP